MGMNGLREDKIMMKDVCEDSLNRFDYGKIVNDQLIYPPIEYIENGTSITGYDEEFLLERGWKKVIYCEQPGFTENETNIVEYWTLVEE